jgi:hypothetical protein
LPTFFDLFPDLVLTKRKHFVPLLEQAKGFSDYFAGGVVAAVNRTFLLGTFRTFSFGADIRG